jgi:hypothetical protein
LNNTGQIAFVGLMKENFNEMIAFLLHADRKPLQTVLRIWIRSDPYYFPGPYSNGHNKINWKGKFTTYAYWLSFDEFTNKENQARCIKTTVLGIFLV